MSAYPNTPLTFQYFQAWVWGMLAFRALGIYTQTYSGMLAYPGYDAHPYMQVICISENSLELTVYAQILMVQERNKSIMHIYRIVAHFSTWNLTIRITNMIKRHNPNNVRYWFPLHARFIQLIPHITEWCLGPSLLERPVNLRVTTTGITLSRHQKTI